jgi:hypothetical protein
LVYLAFNPPSSSGPLTLATDTKVLVDFQSTVTHRGCIGIGERSGMEKKVSIIDTPAHAEQ